MTPRRVLVVDDDDLLRENFCHILQKAGYETMGSASGEAALQMARARVPHIITLDVMMPEMDGFAVLARLKLEPLLRSVPVLMMTSSRRSTDVHRARGLGASTYLAKPVDAQSLLQRVAMLLPASRDTTATFSWSASTPNVNWLD